jgi:hypothetical protein
MKSNAFGALVVFCFLLGGAGPAAAQWQTQSLLIKPGWTAVYLLVDASYTNLDSLVGNDPANPIQEVWLWEPAVSPVQFINNPLSPITGSSQWVNWERTTNGPPNTLASLAPNSAYLIHSMAATNYTWKLKGQPVAPTYSWNASGINLLGLRNPNFSGFNSNEHSQIRVAE